MNEKFTELLILLNEIQKGGKYTVFYHFSGHVYFFNIRIYVGKWYPGKETIFSEEYAMNHELVNTQNWQPTTYDNIINTIKQVTP